MEIKSKVKALLTGALISFFSGAITGINRSQSPFPTEEPKNSKDVFDFRKYQDICKNVDYYENLWRSNPQVTIPTQKAINELYTALYALVQNGKQRAEAAGKNFLILVGENHKRQECLLAELMLMDIADRFSVKHVGMEVDDKTVRAAREFMGKAMNYSFSYIVRDADSRKKNLFYFDSGVTGELDEHREAEVVQKLTKEIDANAILICGGNHLRNIASDSELNKKYEVLNFNSSPFKSATLNDIEAAITFYGEVARENSEFSYGSSNVIQVPIDTNVKMFFFSPIALNLAKKAGEEHRAHPPSEKDQEKALATLQEHSQETSRTALDRIKQIKTPFGAGRGGLSFPESTEYLFVDGKLSLNNYGKHLTGLDEELKKGKKTAFIVNDNGVTYVNSSLSESELKAIVEFIKEHGLEVPNCYKKQLNIFPSENIPQKNSGGFPQGQSKTA